MKSIRKAAKILEVLGEYTRVEKSHYEPGMIDCPDHKSSHYFSVDEIQVEAAIFPVKERQDYD